jgi:N-acetylglutamate synthase-like GNAT family acetyltransferase
MSELPTDGLARLHVREISGDSLRELVTLLTSEGLPTGDVEEVDRRFFAFFDAEGRAVGYGGLERAKGDMLLRSVVTLPATRGAGHGRAITEWLIGEAARSGARDLYLLTMTARGFFAKLGFEAVERTSVPLAIAMSREFSSLCPATAVTMKRGLRA